MICGTVLLSVVMGMNRIRSSVKVRYRPAGEVFRSNWFCAILPGVGRRILSDISGPGEATAGHENTAAAAEGGRTERDEA
jgi:hypothetical protein